MPPVACRALVPGTSCRDLQDSSAGAWERSPGDLQPTLFEVVAEGKEQTSISRVLRRHIYPPDLQEPATHAMVEQAELLAGDLV